MRLTEQEVYNYFGQAYGSRGDSYQRSGRVLEFWLNEDALELAGKVRGGESQPYKVSVNLKPDGLKIASSKCSCPMGGFCKHSAALLFQVIRAGFFKVAERYPSTEVVPTSSRRASVNSQQLSWHFTNWVNNLGAALAEDSQNQDSGANRDSSSSSKNRQLDSVLLSWRE